MTISMLGLLWIACGPGPAERAQQADSDDTGASTLLELPWQPPDTMGPLEVGVLSIEWVDQRGKEMLAEVWYPARPTAGEEPGPYSPLALAGDAVREAAPDTRFGRLPLVAFSHGYGGVRFQSIYLTEYLASHGFVVVSPRHQYNTFLDLNDDNLIDITVQRPGDVIETVDEVLKRSASDDDPLYGLISGEEYAVLGHSFGALTSMMVGGGIIDLNGLRARCEMYGGRLCGSLDELTEDLLERHRMTDSRASVSVPMSTGMWYAFGPEGFTAPGLGEVRQPLVLSGYADPVLPYIDETLPSYNNMDTPKTLVSFEGAGHYAFSNMCDFIPFFTEECEGVEGGWADVARVQQLSRTVTLAHLRTHMLSDGRDQPFLAENWLTDEPDVTVDQD